MNGFVKPKRGAHSDFGWFLYLDGKQVVDSLSAVEGGFIGEVNSKSLEEVNKGFGTSGALGDSGAKAEGGASKNRKLVYEEEVIRKRTGYSSVTTLLKKLRETQNLGRIPHYTPEVYEQIEEGDLYEFKAEIRLHPFHLVADVTQGWEEARKSLGGGNDSTFVNMIGNIEDALYGKNKPREVYVGFAEADGSDSEYRLVMPIKKEQLLVSSLDEFSGRATFVAQVRSKIAEGRKYAAAKLVRTTPILARPDEKFMLDIVPILQGLPGVQEEGITISEEDIILRKPAVIMRPLCIYKG